MIISVGVMVVVSLVGSSLAAFGDYLHVAATARPSIASLSGLTGISWLSPGVLVAGTLAAIGLGRWPRAAFVVGVTTSVLGTPALYLSGWVTILAVLAPFAASADDSALVTSGGAHHATGPSAAASASDAASRASS
jgi:hypothetical protein